MKKVLILAFSDLRHDARVVRQVNFLKDHYLVTVVCFDAPDDWGVEIIHKERIRPGIFKKAITSFFLLTKFFRVAYRLLYDDPAIRRALRSRSFDLIIANDIESLPLAFKLKKKEKILFDAHEFAPRHFEDKKVWRIFFQDFNKFLCKEYLPGTDAMMTIGEGLAKEYAAHYPVNPVIITNASRYVALEPVAPVTGSIRLIHHGAANPSRQLEGMIEMMDHLDKRFTLDLMLLSPAIANEKTRGYLDELKKIVAGNPMIHIIDPVRTEEVVNAIHHYDIGIFLLPPINFNYANTLPNKLFDFIQARLAIAIGPTPEMASLVASKFDLGVISEDFTPRSLAARLNALTTDKVFHYKKQSALAARELSPEKNEKILNDLVAQLLS